MRKLLAVVMILSALVVGGCMATGGYDSDSYGGGHLSDPDAADTAHPHH